MKSASFPIFLRRTTWLALALGGSAWAQTASAPLPHASATHGARAVIGVTLVTPQPEQQAGMLPAQGFVAPWQEALIGTELQGARLVQVRVQVGDVVRRGQVLAECATEQLDADLQAQKAVLAEASASLAEAERTALRAAQLKESGALSTQQLEQSATARQLAQARLLAAHAAVRAAQIRLSQARILAPDAGIISAQLATVGTVTQAGQELFRLIRQSRLEWRAELNAEDAAGVHVGQSVQLDVRGAGTPLSGRVRSLAPGVDPHTRKTLVYVDLPTGSHAMLKAGQYLSGHFVQGTEQVLTLPASAVLVRDGRSYAFVLEASTQVRMVPLELGRIAQGRIAVLAGLSADARVVRDGGAFLNDGDRVRIVEPAPVAARPPVAKP